VVNLFISWSGNQSEEIARCLRVWIPSVLQAVKPFFTPKYIDKGRLWNSEISSNLQSCDFGIICLTKGNLRSPWIIFEAGALSKSMNKAHVCPIIFEIQPTDVEFPLASFQMTRFIKKEIKDLVSLINSQCGDRSLSHDVFENVFEKWWPELQTSIKEAISSHPQQNAAEEHPERTESDMIREILAISRKKSTSEATGSNKRVIITPAIRDLIKSLDRVVDSIQAEDSIEIIKSLNKLKIPLGYIV
jgi:hypothetical protein